jgi:hypothetical protein
MPCPTCRRGCSCGLDGPGCGHYGCYGTGPRDCPGVEAEERRYAVMLAARRTQHAADRARRARLSAAYTALLATTGYGLARLR